MRLFLATALCATPVSAMACGSDADPDLSFLSATMWDRIEEVSYVAKDDLLAATGTVSAVRWDLNGDGKDEVCIAAETMQTCSVGNVVCLFVVLGSGPDHPVLLETAAHELDRAESSNDGWQDLVESVRMADGTTLETIYRFGKHDYQPVE